MHDVITDRNERHGGELVVGALGFLHRQHVDIGALQPVGDPVDASANGVHVPGGQPHALQPTSVEVALPMLNAKTHRLIEPDRGSVVDQNLCVATGRAAVGTPGQQRRAQRSRMTAATLILGHPHRGQARPADTVGCGRHRRATHHGVTDTAEHHLAVDDRGQHVDGNIALIEPQPPLVGPRRPTSPMRRASPAGRSRTITKVSRCAGTSSVSRSSRSGTASHRRQPARGVPVHDRGQRSDVGLDAKRHSRIGAVRVTTRRPQQPAVQPLPARVPGHANAAACSVARICDVRTGAAVSSRTATTSSGEISTTAPVLVRTRTPADGRAGGRSHRSAAASTRPAAGNAG